MHGVRHMPTRGRRNLCKIENFPREALGLPQIQHSDELETVPEDAVVGPSTGPDREEMEADRALLIVLGSVSEDDHEHEDSFADRLLAETVFPSCSDTLPESEQERVPADPESESESETKQPKKRQSRRRAEDEQEKEQKARQEARAAEIREQALRQHRERKAAEAEAKTPKRRVRRKK
jgi:phage terminase small subunit